MQSWPSFGAVPGTHRAGASHELRSLSVACDSRVLITTDVWARGIDVQNVSLVINYDLPS